MFFFYTLVFLGLESKRFVAASLCAGLSMGLRAENGLLLLTVLLGTWLYERKKLGRAVVVGSLVPLAIAAWTRWYFGSPLATSWGEQETNEAGCAMSGKGRLPVSNGTRMALSLHRRPAHER